MMLSCFAVVFKFSLELGRRRKMRCVYGDSVCIIYVCIYSSIYVYIEFISIRCRAVYVYICYITLTLIYCIIHTYIYIYIYIYISTHREDRLRGFRIPLSATRKGARPMGKQIEGMDEGWIDMEAYADDDVAGEGQTGTGNSKGKGKNKKGKGKKNEEEEEDEEEYKDE